MDHYPTRIHRAIGAAPVEAWRSDGWLPRLPDSLEALDTLLVIVAKPRVVRRDGIHFEGLRFLDPTLAAYVGEAVTLRYDPRDVGEIRVFYRNAFLCRAINPEYAGQSITLKDVQAARSAHRRQVRQVIKDKRGRVVDLLPAAPRSPASQMPKPERVDASRPLLHRAMVDRKYHGILVLNPWNRMMRVDELLGSLEPGQARLLSARRPVWGCFVHNTLTLTSSPP